MTNYKVMSIRMMVVLAFAPLVLLILFFTWFIDGGFDKGMFRGPYEIVSEKIQVKQEDFTRNKTDGGLPFSKAKELDLKLFEESIARNKASASGRVGQLYNYAIDTSGRIFVAVWTANNLNALDRVGKCTTPAPPVPQYNAPREAMINWFAQEPSFDRITKLEEQTPAPPPSQSPCWLKRGGGILDAMSKHFMLAQGDGTTVGYYEEGWVNAKVAYAGEITVDVRLCTYSVNNQSGTYQPLPARYTPEAPDEQQPAADQANRIRAALAQFFADKLKIAPSIVNGEPVVVKGVDQKIKGAC